jgi:hypothetical protein
MIVIVIVIETIIGITVMAIMNGAITTECGCQTKPFAGTLAATGDFPLPGEPAGRVTGGPL